MDPLILNISPTSNMKVLATHQSQGFYLFGFEGCPSSPFWGTYDFFMDFCPSSSCKGFTEMSRDATYDITENIN